MTTPALIEAAVEQRLGIRCIVVDGDEEGSFVIFHRADLTDEHRNGCERALPIAVRYCWWHCTGVVKQMFGSVLVADIEADIARSMARGNLPLPDVQANLATPPSPKSVAPPRSACEGGDSPEWAAVEAVPQLHELSLESVEGGGCRLVLDGHMMEVGPGETRSWCFQADGALLLPTDSQESIPPELKRRFARSE